MECLKAASDSRIITYAARLEPNTADNHWFLAKLNRNLATGLAEETSSGCRHLLSLGWRERPSTRRGDCKNARLCFDVSIERAENFPCPTPKALQTEEPPEYVCQITISHSSFFLELTHRPDQLCFRDSHRYINWDS